MIPLSLIILMVIDGFSFTVKSVFIVATASSNFMHCYFIFGHFD